MASVVAIASVSTAFAYIVYFRVLRRRGRDQRRAGHPARPGDLGAARRGFLERAAGGPVHFVGFALIALGLALIDGSARPSQRNSTARALTPHARERALS